MSIHLASFISILKAKKNDNNSGKKKENNQMNFSTIKLNNTISVSYKIQIPILNRIKSKSKYNLVII
jgi:hypothetical protein